MLTYGSDHCADGDLTLVTVVYPVYPDEAMYVVAGNFILKNKNGMRLTTVLQ
ncbi:MAG: hypothetical protein JWQ09_4603 [Segetibacter sp.]|nr:hypothetical protein [Segetibacter sp.]